MPDPIDPTDTAALPEDQNASAASSIDETAPHGSGKPKFGAPAVAGEVGTLGPYRVVKQLGAGGMGAVYLAVDTRLDRKLALKVMLPEFAADRDARERFLREARTAAKITHDNVVIVHEADEREGVPYIAMQFLQGYPLDQYLKDKGTPPLPHVIRIARETALGLAAAHAIGLVHRDIKPANLWLEAPNGRVKVLDFGLAKPIDGDTEVTKSGAVVGTPAYMSPEQARGRKVDHRTDLFSLGGVLYRLCTGRTPFAGANVAAVFLALGADDPTPVRELNPAVPESLAQLIHQLLAKKPEQRPQTANEVAARLRAILEQLLAPSTPVVAPSGSVPAVSAADVSASQPVVVHPLPHQPPIVVSMQITAPAENAFAHLEDEDASEPTRAEPASDASKPQRKKGGKGLLFAVGAAVLLAAVAVAVVVSQMGNKGQPEAKGPGPTPPNRNADPKLPTPKGADADRAAAEWVLSLGGVVRVNGENSDIKAAADLPRNPFTLSYANLTRIKVSDAELIRLKELKGLTTLYLNGTPITDAGLLHLKELSGLTVLILQDTKVSDAGLTHLKEFKSLKELNLNNTQVTNAGWKLLKEIKNLTWLDLGNTSMTDAELVHVKELKNLTWISLTGTSVTDAGLVHVKEFKNLTYLNLYGLPTSDAGLAHLKELKNLTTLYLNNTQVTDAGLLHLTELPALKTVSLGGTKVTDAGLVHLKELKGLAALYLSGPKVTDEGLVHLKECTALTFLDLRETKATAKGLAGLRAALPACRIVLYDGVTIEPKVVTDPDRKAAAWVLSLGGVVRINGENHDRKAVDELPKERFTLNYVSLRATKVTDAELTSLKELKNLTYLLLDTTQVTDAGLTHLKDIQTLFDLKLNGTQVSDAGLAHLKELRGLQAIHLSGTPVTDAGLTHLKELKLLTFLDLRKTKVTAKGVGELAAALPGCQILHDGGAIEPKVVADPDRKAAEWVLAQGGVVRVNGENSDRKAAAELPKERFTLTAVNLVGKPVTDTGLVNLKGINSLTDLDLGVTPITDTGLAHLKGLKKLTHLNLSYTKVTDAGLAHLKDLSSLTRLGLHSAEVTDAGWVHLKKLPALTWLNVVKTKVTAKGLEEFSVAAPGCKIDHDGGTIEPKVSADLDRKAAEWVLSIGGWVKVNGEAREIKALADLPAGALRLKVVNLDGIQQATDAGLANLKELKSLTHLHLDKTSVTDAGLAHIKGAMTLFDLKLNDTQVTDAGLAQIKELKNLQAIQLTGTQVTDAGLAHLKELKALTFLDLRWTKVTAKGVQELAAALPKCKIEFDPPKK